MVEVELGGASPRSPFLSFESLVGVSLSMSQSHPHLTGELHPPTPRPVHRPRPPPIDQLLRSDRFNWSARKSTDLRVRLSSVHSPQNSSSKRRLLADRLRPSRSASRRPRATELWHIIIHKIYEGLTFVTPYSNRILQSK
jgi:hypothetical protein